ncbi:hypothetical protein OAC79_03045 [Amylibacter sp.]|nr:hypothetical protein [Amylibacter sp.]
MSLLTKSLFTLGACVVGSFLLFPRFTGGGLFLAPFMLSVRYNSQLYGRILELLEAENLNNFLLLMGNRYPRLISGIEQLEFSLLPLGLEYYTFIEDGRSIPPNGLLIELSFLLGIIPGCGIVVYIIYLMLRSLLSYKSFPLLVFYSFLLIYACFETTVFKFYFWASLGIIAATLNKKRLS